MVQKIIAGAFALIMVGAIVAGAIVLAQGPQDGEGGLGRSRGRGQAAQSEALPQESQTQIRGGRGNGGQGQSTVVERGGRGQQQAQPRNVQGQGQGQGQNGAGSGVPQADVAPEDWRTVEGTAVALSDLVIELADGSTLTVGLGPEHYREDQGFEIEIGQRLAISGFDEDGEFKAGTVENLATGETITLRTADGRPMWAGQGQGKNRS